MALAAAGLAAAASASENPVASGSLPLALFFAVWCFCSASRALCPLHLLHWVRACQSLSRTFFRQAAGVSARLSGIQRFALRSARFCFPLCTVLYLDAGGEVNLIQRRCPLFLCVPARRTARLAASGLFLQNRLRGLLQRAGRLPFVRRHKGYRPPWPPFSFSFFWAWFSLPVSLHAPVAIGHRGGPGGGKHAGSGSKCIDAGADYAEVDVLLSKDGVPWSFTTLTARLAGDNRNVYTS